jgi:DNA invertase Pin-like site-specific DNA recombinase
MTHGGARKGAGRPPTPVDEKRLMSLRNQGVTIAKIAERFGVTETVVKYAIKRIKREQTT